MCTTPAWTQVYGRRSCWVSPLERRPVGRWLRHPDGDLMSLLRTEVAAARDFAPAAPGATATASTTSPHPPPPFGVKEADHDRRTSSVTARAAKNGPPRSDHLLRHRCRAVRRPR